MTRASDMAAEFFKELRILNGHCSPLENSSLRNSIFKKKKTQLFQRQGESLEKWSERMEEGGERASEGEKERISSVC